MSIRNASIGLTLVLAGLVFLCAGLFGSLNDVLKPYLQGIFGLSFSESALVHFSYFFASVFMPIPAGFIVRKIGYRSFLFWGFSVLLFGVLLGMLAGQVGVFAFFLIAIFSIALGTSALTVITNAYVSLVSTARQAPQRLNFINAFYGVGAIFGPILGTAVLFSGKTVIQPSDSTFLYGLIGVGIALVVLLFVFFRISEPELEKEEGEKNFFSVLENKRLRLGILAMFLYVGAEVSTGSMLVRYLGMEEIWGMAEENAGLWVSLYWGTFMSGRFIASILGKKVSGPDMLRFNGILSIIFISVVIASVGSISGWAVLLLGIANSVMFPCIYAISVRGMGNLTQAAGSLIMMAGVGGAVITQLQGFLADWLGLPLSFGLILLCYLYILWYAIRGFRLA